VRRRHDDADIGVAHRDEHVFVGRIVADRQRERAARCRGAQPVERATFVGGAVANLEGLGARQALELRVRLEPFVDH
jgi:hypothetical protein